MRTIKRTVKIISEFVLFLTVPEQGTPIQFYPIQYIIKLLLLKGFPVSIHAD